jgi:hypothetical protein
MTAVIDLCAEKKSKRKNGDAFEWPKIFGSENFYRSLLEECIGHHDYHDD